MLSQEINIGQWVALSPSTPALSDDRPTNEYYLLRTLFHPDVTTWRNVKGSGTLPP